MNTVPADSPQVPSSPPRAVAISGLLFAVLFIISMALIRRAVPADPNEVGKWLEDEQLRNWVGLALNLIPFAGIAFLWYMAVLRNRIGLREGRFFDTVFLGSGLLFVAMLFVTASVAKGLVDTFATEGNSPAFRASFAVGRPMTYTLMNTFALKMAAVFMIVTSTIGLRTGVLARWVSLVGFVCALVLLLVITDFAWIVLIFPAWVMLVSVYILAADFHPGWTDGKPDEPG
jgi:hypothetical protein